MRRTVRTVDEYRRRDLQARRELDPHLAPVIVDWHVHCDLVNQPAWIAHFVALEPAKLAACVTLEPVEQEEVMEPGVLIH